MKKLNMQLVLPLFLLTVLAVSCNFFEKKDDCSSVFCSRDDEIHTTFKSKTDSVTNLIGPGQFPADSLNIAPILVNQNGGMPFFAKSFGPSGQVKVFVRAHENLRGFVFKLAHFPTDTLLMTTGIRPADPCCRATTTVSQLLVNDLLVPTIGSVILVDIYK